MPGEETSSQTKLEQGEAPDQWTETAAAETSLSGEVRQSDVSWQGPDGDDKAEAAAESDGLPPAASLSVSAAWIEHLKEQWMAWLGGLCVGLAGIFLVRYSIEQGYLGPTARITLALVTGIALHVAAEWLRRRSVGQFQALAALAGGASITLFAALLAALHLYQLMSPLLVFVLLTIVSLITMALAVIHGPLLAIMGLLGAYAVPILVDTGSGSITGVLLYALVISSSALALMHFVYRYWIWVGMLLGSLSWWFLSLLTSDADTVRGFYLAALSYLVIAGPTRDWTLVKEDWLGDAKARIPNWRASDDVASAPVRNSILVILLAYGLSIYSQAYSYSSSLSAIYYWTPQIILLFLASRQKVTMTWLPWAPMAVHCVAWFATGLGYRSGTLQIIGPSGAEQIGFLNLAGWMSVVYFALSLWLFRMHQNQTRWIALALVSPLLWLALSYLLVAGIAQSWVWGSIAIVI
ncbi:MAG: DUF2339 domain-containing protein, partial [Gammaproteobacteria bacterium]|nr:DUF2339 domain-containing protein [Gammaproteobacteria bacterium]